VSGVRILVVEGNVAAMRARQTAALGYDAATGYGNVLRQLDPGVRCDIVRPADGPTQLPAAAALADYDGVAMTGSALNVYAGGGAVERQVELARAVFAAGVPFFGSCWGLQVAVTAAGGEVRPNPRGREFGFGRRITLNAAGAAHPMYSGKPAVFEAPTVHRDDIAALPAGAQVLASNDMGLQAAAFTIGRCDFWGVQYHPEYDYADIAAAAERYGQTLVQEGMFRDAPALHTFAEELRELQTRPDDAPLLWRHGLGPAMRERGLRLLELSNWLWHQVLPRVARRV